MGGRVVEEDKLKITVWAQLPFPTLNPADPRGALVTLNADALVVLKPRVLVTEKNNAQVESWECYPAACVPQPS